MAREGFAHRGPVPIHQIEYAFRHACFGHDFSEHVRAQGCDFARLQYDRATSGKSGSDFAANLIDWPIPGRDHSADANRLATHLRGAKQLFELEVLERGK